MASQLLDTKLTSGAHSQELEQALEVTWAGKQKWVRPTFLHNNSGLKDTAPTTALIFEGGTKRKKKKH